MEESQNNMNSFFGIEDDLTMKKTLLQREIVEKNYNKVQFVDYCSTRKQGGDDLQNWTVSELQAVIKDFVRIHEEEEKSRYFTQPSQTQPSSNKISMEQLTPHNLNSVSSTREIECRKIEPSVLNNKEITVDVRNPKSNTTSLLSSNYISYEVVTSSTNWQVIRRFSDFLWLRETLKRFFPRIYIPPMPNKKLGGRRFEEDYVLKRMNLLKKFINNVVSSELLKASEPLISFLSIIDRNQFEFKMKELSAYTPSAYVEETRTLDGKAKLLEDIGMQNLNKNISLYYQLQGQLIQNLSYNMKCYYTNIGAACTNLENVQKDFEILTMLNSKVLMKEEVINNYKELGIFCKNWKRILFNQNEIMKKHIRDFYKYIKMEGIAFSELIVSWDELNKRFDSENKKLLSRKEKLWTTMDISKWEIMEDFLKIDRLLLYRDKGYAFAKMCTKDTQAVNSLQNQLFYANYLNNSQLRELIEKQAKDMLKNTKDFSTELYPTLTDMLDVWGNLNSFFQTI
ncbi:MAG: hypothetical protein MJ252_10610 [archaeon]|nr:hypothetical protein [archaeon]